MKRNRRSVDYLDIINSAGYVFHPGDEDPELYEVLLADGEECWLDMGDTASDAKKRVRTTSSRATQPLLTKSEAEPEGLDNCGKCGGYLIPCDA